MDPIRPGDVLLYGSRPVNHPPHTHRVAENPASDAYGWMTASDRADDGTAAVRPSVFLYRGLLATSHRSVHPRAPVRGKIHASHDRAVPERCARGRARASDRRGGQKYRRCERTSSSGVHGPFVLFSSASRGLAAAAVDDGGEPPSRGDARVGARGGAGVGTSISCRVCVLSTLVRGVKNAKVFEQSLVLSYV